MSQGSPSKRSANRLKQLVEIACDDLWNLSLRGLKLTIETVEPTGSPIEHLRLFATLYFLPLGSPFCCGESSCHIPHSSAERLAELGERLARDFELHQPVLVKFDHVQTHVIAGVQFDPISPQIPSANVELDAKDPLGRTALIRATQRDYTELFELLLERGADRSLRDNKGKTAFDYLHANHWLRSLYNE